MTLALKQSVFISAQMLRFDKYFKAIQQKRGSSHLGNMSTVVYTKKCCKLTADRVWSPIVDGTYSYAVQKFISL